MAERTQRSNILLAFISLTAVIAVVSLIGFFTLGKGPEIIQGQAEADEYRVSGKVPARILELRVKEGDKVKAGDTLVILEAPDVMAKLSQAQAAEQAAGQSARRHSEGLAGNSCKLLSKCGRSQSRSRNCREVIQPCEPTL